VDIQKIFGKYESHTRQWIDALGGYNEETFYLKPSEEDWCMSEVYDHLIKVTDKCLSNALACAANNGETGHSGFGPAIFSLMGSFPPVKLKIKKIPARVEDIYNPNKISREQAKEGLEQALQRMKAAIPKVQQASKDHRIEHWAGGWFNGQQWYHSAEMHLKHHFRQKKRIDKFLHKH
jgi:hypothetical protein